MADQGDGFFTADAAQPGYGPGGLVGGPAVTVAPYVPEPPAPVRDPAVLALDPVGGWNAASPLVRGLTVALIPLLILNAVAIDAGSESLTWISMLGLAFAFGAAARVLRPYPPGIPVIERRLRHGLAACCMAAGIPLVILMLGVYDSWEDGSNDAPNALYYGIWAAPLGLLTIVWGLTAALARAVSAAGRRRSGPSARFAHGVRGTEQEHGGAGWAL